MSKKDLREDEVMHAIYVGLEWINEHKTKIIIVTAVIAFAAVAVWGVISYKNYQQAKITDQIAKADQIFNVGNYETAMEDYAKIAADHSMSGLASNAYIKAGKSAFLAGKYDKAIEYYSNARNKTNDDYFKMTITMDIAKLYSNIKEYDKAAAEFDKVLSMDFLKENNNLLSEANYFKARAYQLKGMQKEAKEIYSEIAGLYQNTEYGKKAKMRLLEMGEELPKS